MLQIMLVRNPFWSTETPARSWFSALLILKSDLTGSEDSAGKVHFSSFCHIVKLSLTIVVVRPSISVVHLFSLLLNRLASFETALYC